MREALYESAEDARAAVARSLSANVDAPPSKLLVSDRETEITEDDENGARAEVAEVVKKVKAKALLKEKLLLEAEHARKAALIAAAAPETH